MKTGDVFILKSNSNIGIKIGIKVRGKKKKHFRKIQHADMQGQNAVLSPIHEEAHEFKILRLYRKREHYDIKKSKGRKKKVAKI